MYFPKIKDEVKFLDIEYLSIGSSRQQAAFDALVRINIMKSLAALSPILAGTIPINIDVQDSDLDILCDITNVNPKEFVRLLETQFGSYKDFNINIYYDADPRVVASFFEHSFQIEIFAQNKATTIQNAFRHMLTEYRILCEKGEHFRKEVIELKNGGLKTEPAFARLLGLSGDPYEAILALWH